MTALCGLFYGINKMVTGKTVKFFTSKNNNAPQLLNVQGSMLALLDACLVSGIQVGTVASLTAINTTATATVHCHVGSLEMLVIFANIPLRVHCHVGSLEMNLKLILKSNPVHCHVGSLEIVLFRLWFPKSVHCHVGSLEKIAKGLNKVSNVHCHVGSLEKAV